VGQLFDRRAQSESRLQMLRAKLSEAEDLAQGKACVYVTGSFGRCEASPHSDLDLFIVGKRDGKPGADGKERSLLTHLDEICILADLIKIARELGFPEFSGDGRYLVHHSVHDFTKTLGKPEDDAINTFTARLLLLLESRSLLEDEVYLDVIKEVIGAYWRDYDDHKDNFMPAYLANDILRLWRTFCVNYEAGTVRIPDEEKAKGKLKNYKLKHSRMLTCYSALLFLLAMFVRNKSVSQADAELMINMTPTQRLEWIQKQPDLSCSHQVVEDLLRQYEIFLETTNASEAELIGRFMDKNTSREFTSAAYKFGDLVFDALYKIGHGNQFYRLLVV
jgi:predicted nucleotidyltransferase